MFKYTTFICSLFLSLGISPLSTLIAHPNNTEETAPSYDELIGRWDLTVDVNGKPSPSWLEVSLSGNRTLVGSYVSVVGSARPVAEIQFENQHFSFTIPPQWEQGDGDFKIEGEIVGGKIEGSVTMSDGSKYAMEGVRAPLLPAVENIQWQKAKSLFNGKNMDGWQIADGSNWTVKEGILTNPEPGANLISKDKFEDFKLTVEFRVPEEGNSGIYLRGRYEVQIVGVPEEVEPESHGFSGVYGFLTPNQVNAKPAGEWQTYEITLTGRVVTIVANGKTVICNQIIPGITGGAIDSQEGEPGPIYLQGDHTSVEFRKIDIALPKN